MKCMRIVVPQLSLCCRFEWMVLQTFETRYTTVWESRASLGRVTELLGQLVSETVCEISWHLPQKCQCTHYEKHFIITTFSALLFNWKILGRRGWCCRAGNYFIFENVRSWKLIPRRGNTSYQVSGLGDDLVVFMLISFISGLRLTQTDTE